MTKHWEGRGLVESQPTTPYLPSSRVRARSDHQLDFISVGKSGHNIFSHMLEQRNGAQRPSFQHGRGPLDLPSAQGQDACTQKPVKLMKTASLMDTDVVNEPSKGFYEEATQTKMEPSVKQQQVGLANTWEHEANSNGNKKKNYQRYPKPPYSYLAMIAMVIQNSSEKRLTLSEILKEISTLFPFFNGKYKGWRDSVRHNLSSYDCFVKVLKDPSKPQGKGNYWTVEVSKLPLELLKRQNTAVSRQDETIFAQDLAPYILHGHTATHKPAAAELHPTPPLPPVASSRHSDSPSTEDPYRPKLDSSFAIDSLLHSFRPPSISAGLEVGVFHHGRDNWGGHEPLNPAGTHATSPPGLRNFSSSSANRSASASSASPASSSSDDDWRGSNTCGRKRAHGNGACSDGYDDSYPPSKSLRRGGAGSGSAPPWELPTSYAKYTPPNTVAPPSMRFNGGPFMPLGGIPFYSYGATPVSSGHFVSHGYWPLLPSGHMSLQAPPLLMDLDSMLQSVPPNKSVFDVLSPATQSQHPPPNQYSLQTGGHLARYSQY